MGGSCSAFLVFILLLGLGTLSGCGSSNTAGPAQPPAAVTISPSTNASMDIGSVLVFSATAHASGGSPVGTPITFQSSNTAVLTISSGGQACAGSWNSLTNPITCTPGPAGVAEVTAVSEGVSSTPVTVNVHEHVDKITIAPVQGIVVPCLSDKQVVSYKATAFSQAKDITSTVGPFTWTQGNAIIVTLKSGLPQQNFNEVEATAGQPGHRASTCWSPTWATARSAARYGTCSAAGRRTPPSRSPG